MANQITLAANPDYNNPVKGTPIANGSSSASSTEGATRVADLQSGTAQIDPRRPVDRSSGAGRRPTGDANAAVRRRLRRASRPICRRSTMSASARHSTTRSMSMPSGTRCSPGPGQRLPNHLPSRRARLRRSRSHPTPMIPDKAKSLLRDAGVSGLETTIAVTNSERKDLVEAIAGYLSDVGIRTDGRGAGDRDLQRPSGPIPRLLRSDSRAGGRCSIRSICSTSSSATRATSLATRTRTSRPDRSGRGRN